MKKLKFDYQKTSLVAQSTLQKLGQQLKPEIEKLQRARKNGYETDYASINVPFDEKMIVRVQEVIAEKKKLKPCAVVVIGIGGSNLGALAVQQALFGKFYNEQVPEVKIYFADTIDSDYILDIILLMEQELEKGHEVILNVVSKSGTTVEAIANFEIFLQVLKSARSNDYKNYIVVTTDRASKLWQFAQQENITCLEVPEKVGGRFSVFSPVGLFPLGMIGINLTKLHQGARDAVEACVKKDFNANPAAINAAIVCAQYQQGITINNLFLFSVDLQSVGSWYRQLVGESLGKPVQLRHSDSDQGDRAIGIVPLASVGSTDLHSMAQLYLGGPRTIFTEFVSVKKNKSNLNVPVYKGFDLLVAHIQGKSLVSIMDAILQGVKKAYSNDQRPFVSITLEDKSAYCIGQFLQYKMIEIMYIGYLLNVNPFDQPHVERYKKETRKILTHE